MSESTFTSFAVAGAGTIGSLIAEALLKYKSAGKIKEVFVLTRTESNNPVLSSLASKGATIVPVDYTFTFSLINTLSSLKVEVFFATFSRPGGELDPAAPKVDLVAEAAKAAGVKLFIPSEFGMPTSDVKEPETKGFIVEKLRLHQSLRDLNLPFTLFFTGLWPEYCLVPALSVDFEKGTALVGGDGNMPISWTSNHDVASFVAYILTTLPPSKLEWQTFRIEGDRLSYNQIFEAFEKKTGKHIAVSYRPVEELKAAVARDPHGEFMSSLFWMWAIGEAQVGKQDQLSNGLFSEWNPKKVIDIIAP